MNKVLLLLCLSTILSTSNSFTRQLVNSQTTFPGKRGWRQ